jgi:hypothetical protein
MAASRDDGLCRLKKGMAASLSNVSRVWDLEQSLHQLLIAVLCRCVLHSVLDQLHSDLV